MSTLPDAPTLYRLRRARVWRRIFLFVLFAVLALALATQLGVRTATAAAISDGYEMRVTFAAVTRPGLDTPFEIELSHPGGFDGELTLAVRTNYLDMFDKNGGLDPDPAESSSDEAWVYWKFTPPQGNVMRVSLDAIMAPSQEWGEPGAVRLVDDGRTVVQVNFRTWVMP